MVFISGFLIRNYVIALSSAPICTFFFQFCYLCHKPLFLNCVAFPHPAPSFIPTLSCTRLRVSQCFFFFFSFCSFLLLFPKFVYRRIKTDYMYTNFKIDLPIILVTFLHFSCLFRVFCFPLFFFSKRIC